MAIEPMSKIIRKSEELEGLKIKTPSTTEKVILSLFVDDSAVFTSKNDSVKSLFTTLDRWCMASGAKFNKEKTVIIPVGSLEYRNHVSESPRLNPTSTEQIQEDIQILSDSKTTRYLGAQCDNKQNNIEPWPMIISKIENQLKTWEKAYPTLEGCKLITQMMIGRMTQFHTRAQGMPDSIEKRLSKLMREFIWQSKAPPP
jgi:hypothetical protein